MLDPRSIVGRLALARDDGAARPRRAHQVFAHLAAADIDQDDVTETLERDGVKRFVDSFRKHSEQVEAKRNRLATSST